MMHFEDAQLEQEFNQWYHRSHLNLDLGWSAYHLLLALFACSAASWPAAAAAAASLPCTLLAWRRSEFYLRHRLPIVHTSRVLRTVVFYYFAPFPVHANSHLLQQWHGHVLYNLVLVSLAVANSSLGLRLPLRHHAWSAVAMAAVAVSANAERCAHECALPGQEGGYLELAEGAARGAALLSLPPHLPDRRALSARQACWALHTAAQLVVGAALPTLVLAHFEEGARARFLARRAGPRPAGQWRLLPAPRAAWHSLLLLVPALLVGWQAATAAALLGGADRAAAAAVLAGLLAVLAGLLAGTARAAVT